MHIKGDVGFGDQDVEIIGYLQNNNGILSSKSPHRHQEFTFYATLLTQYTKFHPCHNTATLQLALISFTDITQPIPESEFRLQISKMDGHYMRLKLTKFTLLSLILFFGGKY